MNGEREFELKGWHVLAIFASAFGVILAVNLTLAFNAVGSFPGLETKNSYVASQKFEADRQAQEALGWDVSAGVDDGMLRLSFLGPDGQPVRPEITSAIVGRPTHVKDDVTPVFAWTGSDFEAPIELGTGSWSLILTARAEDGTNFRQRLSLYVRG